MLKVNDLKTQIKAGLTNIYRPAIRRSVMMMFPNESEYAEELADDIAETFDELTSDQFADLLANAIDYYVKNITISGTLITSGSPTTHTCSIVASPTPITAGKIPNTLGIS